MARARQRTDVARLLALCAGPGVLVSGSPNGSAVHSSPGIARYASSIIRLSYVAEFAIAKGRIRVWSKWRIRALWTVA
jgi:hypothetical protein